VLTDEQKQQIIDLAKGNAHDVSNAQIGKHFGISGERVRQIVAASGQHKPRKLGAVYECKKPKCKRRFRGTRQYGGGKARYCHKHRR
jgi:hypothetical protein